MRDIVRCWTSAEPAKPTQPQPAVTPA